MRRSYEANQARVLKLLFWVIILTGFIVTFLLLNRKEDEIPTAGSVTAIEGLTLLIAGVDSNELTDTIMLASIDDEAVELSVVSIPRDLLVFVSRVKAIKSY